MEQKEADLAVIEQWSRKCYEYYRESNDPLLSLLAKALDTIAVLASPTSDSASILRSLQSLELELMTANQYDNKDFDPLRHFSYGFIESFSLLAKMQKRNNSEEQLSIIINDQIADLSPSQPPVVKEEPFDDYYHDDEMLNVNPLLPCEPKDELVDSMEVSPADNQPAENIPRAKMGDDSIEKENEKINDEPIDHSKDCSNKTVEVKKRKMPSRSVTKPMKYRDYDEDSGDDSESEVNKKSRPNYPKKNYKKRTHVDVNDTSSLTSKKPREVRSNKTELECPSCEFRTQSVDSWLLHLNRMHSTTPHLVGLALLCECGHVSSSNRHLRDCNVANCTVIRKGDRTPNTPQCILCEVFPKTVCGYVVHLKHHHKTTLKKNNIYLKCSCGIDIRCLDALQKIKHGKECRVANFSVIRKGDEPPKTPQCILCEFYPKTAYGFMIHLKIHHNTTLKKNNIYLKCSCGTDVVFRDFSRITHGKKCDPRSFTMHELEKE